MMDDVLTFASEKDSPAPVGLPWKILIADDEPSVHLVTRLALGDFTFEGRRLELLSAYGEDDTRRLLQEHPDTALLLLDVVMDTVTSGFDLVRYVRDELKNKDLRIVMRTGQSGNAPEDRIIINYDINDFKDKTELTVAKLRTTMISSLRTYSHLRIIEDERRKSTSHRLYLHSIISSLSSVVVTLDSQFQVVLWNHQAEVFTGLAEAQVTGKSLFAVAPVFEPLRTLFSSVLSTGQPMEREGVPLTRGTAQYLHLSVQPLDNGQNTELLIRLDDRTAARNSGDQWVRSQKLQAVSELAGAFVQELEAAVEELAEELGRTKVSSPQLKDLARRTRATIERMRRFARTGERKPEALDLGVLVADRLQNLGLPGGVQLLWQPTPNVPLYWGSRQDWDFLLDCLLTDGMSALATSTESGNPRVLEVSLRYQDTVSAGRLNRAELEGSPYWLLEVTYHGLRVAPEVLKHAFDPASSGLAGAKHRLEFPLVLSIAELYGGIVELNAGTDGEVTALLALPGLPGPPVPPHHRGTVLVCDDEPLAVQITSKILQKLGFTVLTASDGAGALALFHAHRHEVVLVILDLVLPGQSGLEVFRAIRSDNSHLPVLLSSGYGMGEEAQAVLAEKGTVFLEKPFGSDRLVGAIGRVLATFPEV